MATIAGPRPRSSRTRTRARPSSQGQPWQPRDVRAHLEEGSAPGGNSLLVRHRGWLLVSLLLIAALALAYLWVSWQWVYTLNELHKARAELQALQAERDRLLFEVGRAFSLERIERIARERLGMYRPEPQYLQLDPFVP